MLDLDSTEIMVRDPDSMMLGAAAVTSSATAALLLAAMAAALRDDDDDDGPAPAPRAVNDVVHRHMKLPMEKNDGASGWPKAGARESGTPPGAGKTAGVELGGGDRAARRGEGRAHGRQQEQALSTPLACPAQSVGTPGR